MKPIYSPLNFSFWVWTNIVQFLLTFASYLPRISPINSLIQFPEVNKKQKSDSAEYETKNKRTITEGGKAGRKKTRTGISNEVNQTTVQLM